MSFNFYSQRYNKFSKAQKNIKETLYFPLSKFTGKNLYFAEISFWDFCEISCEKLTKIGVNFSQIWSFFLRKARLEFSKSGIEISKSRIEKIKSRFFLEKIIEKIAKNKEKIRKIKDFFGKIKA